MEMYAALTEAVQASPFVYIAFTVVIIALLYLAQKRRAASQHQNVVWASSAHALIRLETDGKIRSWNRAAEQLYGYPSQEICGRHYNALCTGRDVLAGRPMEDLGVAKRSGALTVEIWQKRKDGSTFLAEIMIAALTNGSQRIIGLTAFCRDITDRRQIERQVQAADQLLQSTIDALSAEICIVNELGIITAVNLAWRHFYAQHVIGHLNYGLGSSYHLLSASAGHNEAARKAIKEGVRRAVNGDLETFEYEYGCRLKCGQHWFRIRLTHLGKDVPHLVIAHENITALKKAEQDLKFSAAVYRAIGEAIMVLDERSAIIAINPAFSTFTGYSEANILGKPVSVLYADQSSFEFGQPMQQMMDKTGRWEGAIATRQHDGGVVQSWLRIDTIYDDHQVSRQRVGMFSKVTDYKLAEKTIWEQANFDTLTRLPNRSMFYDRLDVEIRKAARTGVPFALLFIDLDRFKDINDSLGHDVGDKLLQQAAQRLMACVRDVDTVARLGGDEFTVILSEVATPSIAAWIAQSILHKMAEPFHLDAETAFISASVGITRYPDDARTVEALLKSADQAMYAAKNQGRNRYKFFTSSMQEAMQARMRLVADLRIAVEEQQFCIMYQPIVTLATSSVHKAEALIRWCHPSRGVVEPIEFIAIAEETGLIIEIGNWMFAEVARQVKQWSVHYHADLQITVNISPVQLRGDLERHRSWIDTIHALELPGSCIGVEITEGTLMEASDQVINELSRLRSTGMQVVLDDFGTGYSSLAYLKKFDIDVLKIDQTFVRNMVPRSDDLALCEAIIVMAHKLGIRVVAEGVETREQSELLIQAGCDYGQGYYFSTPMTATEFADLLAQHEASHIPVYP